MKIIKNDQLQNFSAQELGFSMTDSIMPEVIRDDGIDAELTARIGSPVTDPKHYLLLGAALSEGYDTHIDIDGTEFTLVYDLGAERPIEKIYVSCFYNGEINYTIGEFELYASNSRDDLLEEKNKIVYYDNRNKQVLSSPRNNADFLFDAEELEARYFAFRQLNSNTKDGMSRIKNICLFSKEFTHQRYFLVDNALNGGIISGLVPEVSGETKGCPAALTNAIALDDSNVFKAKNASISFNLAKSVKTDHVVIIASGDCNAEFSVEAVKKAIPSEIGRTIYSFDLIDAPISDKLEISIIGEAVIDHISAYSDDRAITVSDEVLTEDFIGLGANVLPHHLFESSRQMGFTEQYMELEKRRIAISNPAFVRVWFQVDWFIMNEDGYVNRKYVFNSPKMQAFYKYMDALKEAGVEVELNFGWKVGYTAQPWFSFPDVFNRKNSAPRDLEHFATSCSDCLRELILNRGYDNIKYLTFYNESNGGTPNGWDFTVPTGWDIKDYWNKMLTAVDNQLKEDGLRDLVKIWVSEVSGSVGEGFKSISDWTDYFNKTSPEKYEYNCFHLYRTSYDESIEYGQKANALAGDHPALVTEYGTYGYGFREGIDFDFERTNVSSSLGFINSGLSGMCFWILSGTYIDEHFFHDGTEACFWRFPTDVKGAGGINGIGRRFYELSLITNYMPRHSKILKSSCSDKGMHAAVCKIGEDDYTIAAEFKHEGQFGRNVNIKLPKNVNKKFYKHVYRLDTVIEGNMIIPPAVDSVEVTDTINDYIDGEYNFVVYTTLPPRTQVVMDEVEVFMKPGETKQLKAHLIDGEGKIKWSIPDCYYNIGFPGTITEDGLYTASDICYKPRVEGNVATHFAVKAEAENGEYAIAIVKVSD